MWNIVLRSIILPLPDVDALVLRNRRRMCTTDLRREIIRLAETSDILRLSIFRKNRGEFARFSDLRAFVVKYVDGNYD